MIDVIDEIKNPWSERKGVFVFDIETNMDNDWSEEGKRNRIFRCGVAYSYDDDKFYEFDSPTKFVEFLNTAPTLVSYNGEGFDFLVLEKHGLNIKKYQNRWKLKNAKSLDIMHTIQESRPEENKEKKYPSLDELIFQHYAVNKTKYDSDDDKQVLEHCFEDVKYTKMLYEEKIWKVPIVERPYKKRRWENYYDDDLEGCIWDGENFTYLHEFGESKYFAGINTFETLLCPNCKEIELSLYEIARMKSNVLICPKCGSVITFGPNNEIATIQTKEEYESNVCPNCGKRITKISYEHMGYGTGSGHISCGVSICPSCHNGCYEWENDDTPGFSDRWARPCCNCGKTTKDYD